MDFFFAVITRVDHVILSKSGMLFYNAPSKKKKYIYEILREDSV